MYKVIVGHSHQTHIFVKNRKRRFDTFRGESQGLRLKIKCNGKSSKR